MDYLDFDLDLSLDFVFLKTKNTLQCLPTSIVTAFDKVVGTGEDVVYELEELRVVGAELDSCVDAIVHSIWGVRVPVDIEVALYSFRLYTTCHSV
jgi:hypothetical protein